MLFDAFMTDPGSILPEKLLDFNVRVPTLLLVPYNLIGRHYRLLQ